MNILKSLDAAFFIREKTETSEVEEVWALALSPACVLINARMLFRGTVDSCLIHPRDVFRFALMQNATSIIIGHNHPSGNLLPSKSDVVMSGNLKRAGELLQIPLIDHVIVTRVGYFSFAEQFWSQGAVRVDPLREF